MKEIAAINSADTETVVNLYTLILPIFCLDDEGKLSVTLEGADNMDSKKQAISNNLQTQWQDHFHVRDQSWKVLQCSIFFFLGVVGLEIKEMDTFILGLAYLSVLATSVFGVRIAFHHRQCQEKKFRIIEIYEKELGLSELIKSALVDANKTSAKKTDADRFHTSTYIIIMQGAIVFVVALMLLDKIF